MSRGPVLTDKFSELFEGVLHQGGAPGDAVSVGGHDVHQAFPHQFPGEPGHPPAKAPGEAAGGDLGQAAQRYQTPQFLGHFVKNRVALRVGDDRGNARELNSKMIFSVAGGMTESGISRQM